MTWADLATRAQTLAWVARVELHDTVDSTNREARRRLDEGAGPGLVVVARRQLAGRGRRGRRWHDVEDGNVALSVTLRMPAVGTLVPLAGGLALQSTFEDLGLSTSLKWPNDVRLVVDGRARKCAGILAEAVGSGPGPPTDVILGIGVDLDWRGHRRTGELASWASMAEVLDGDVDVASLVTSLLEHLGERLAQLQRRSRDVVSDYRTACDTLGRRVRVEGERTELVGLADDVSDDGGLVVRVDGREIVVAAGDVVHLHETVTGAGEPGPGDW